MDRTDYLNHVMQNYQDLTETVDMDDNTENIQYSTQYSVYSAQHGGGENDKPTGGFPPIYIHDEATKNQDETLFVNNDKKKREYEKNKNAVSIKDIINKRRNLTPFISVSGERRPSEQIITDNFTKSDSSDDSSD